MVAGLNLKTGIILTVFSISLSSTSAVSGVLDDSGNFSGSYFTGGVGPILQLEAEKTGMSWTENLGSQTSSFRQFLVALGVAEQKNENLRVFGPNSGAYNTPEDSVEIRQGFSTEKQLFSRFRDDLSAYLKEFNSRKDIYDRLGDTPEGGGLFWSDGTMSSEELAKSKEISKTILDPYPTPNLDDKNSSKNLADDYRAIKKVKESKLLIPNTTLSDLTALHTPVIEVGEWLSQTYQRMGGRGEITESVDGKMSINGLTAMLVNMRFANQEWYSDQKGIHGKTATGVLREILQMKVDRLMTEYRKMRWLDRMAALMAQRQLSRNNKRFNYFLNKIKSKALK